MSVKFSILCPHCTAKVAIEFTLTRTEVVEFPAASNGKDYIAIGRTMKLRLRQAEIASEVAHGKSNKEIAEHFKTTVQVIKNELRWIYKIIGCLSRSELAAILNGAVLPGRM